MVEGVRNAQNAALDEFLDFSVKSVKEITQDGEQGHFALKLTAYISSELMEKLNEAQHRFVHEVLEVSFDTADTSVLSSE